MARYDKVSDWTPAFRSALFKLLTHSINYFALLDFIDSWGEPDKRGDAAFQVNYIAKSLSPKDVYDNWSVSVEWADAVSKPSLMDNLDFDHEQKSRFAAEAWLVSRATGAQLAEAVWLIPAEPAEGSHRISLLLDLPLEHLAKIWKEMAVDDSLPDADDNVVRTWAHWQGIPIGARGRVPEIVLAQYRADWTTRQKPKLI